MATSDDEYEFRISKLKPADLPMARLAEYMKELADLLGEASGVHFVKLRTGSTAIVHRVEPESREGVRERIVAARSAGTGDARAAFERLNAKLAEDGVKGELRPASNRRQKLLLFPGAGHPSPQGIVYGPVTQHATVYGTPVSVGGRMKYANVNLEDVGRVHYCSATRDLAQRIAPHLYISTIKATGTGRFTRMPGGQWEMGDFRIETFEVLEDGTLDESLRAIREMRPLEDGALERLEALRHELVKG